MGDRFCTMFPEVVLQSGKNEAKRKASQAGEAGTKKQREEKVMTEEKHGMGCFLQCKCTWGAWCSGITWSSGRCSRSLGEE